MNHFNKREDDYEIRRKKLAGMDDAAIDAHFWSLLDDIVSPMLTLAHDHTSPAIERSVLLRMGFSSLEAKPLVEEAMRLNLIGHGVGHLVYYLAKTLQCDVRTAGLALMSGEHWELLVEHFKREVF